ncbi:GPI-remodelling mannose-ethanolamine phosphate phosphodiesterase Ted1 [Schizosaccharomyces pombe]|uniref:Uncharacterized protein C23A1.02c n=1 Tax=Schizosaccharomyces pombe (strain 972 / ATCC 24843) TaxID=284812 RepID=YFH2_SCHPO|nr:putative phosphoprotein phosphatase [Schizosaccharomyces pombe]O42841.2 RecName: Full=Uncharacterized protein C23A1.02c [Schizosaccharomyces pombe 972h-]CAA16976.2 phosphoprotein phosphatase (predicted) [Schizosaccharomyces pombe]|eukprot:NP_594432.1 putative phosphoprotein phosphatase [Schizosaccharomyces pombe]
MFARHPNLLWLNKQLSILHYLCLVFLAVYYAYPLLFGIMPRKLQLEDENSFVIMGVADPQIEGNHKIEANGFFKGTLDLWGNDLFLRHLVHMNQFWGQPDAMILLGDLVSFQHLDNEEFNKRAKRLKKITGAKNFWQVGNSSLPARTFENGNIPVWTIAGNHDIGYGCESSDAQISKWEQAMGPVNWVSHFNVSKFPVRVIGINSLSLDDVQFYDANPSDIINSKSFSSLGILALSKEARDAWQFLFDIALEPSIPTILFTHVPLYKPANVCVDEPRIVRQLDFRVKSQNHLSYNTTMKIFELIPSIKLVLSGHDHMGCDYEHPNGAIEHTLPSAMGYFGGNIGFVKLIATNDVLTESSKNTPSVVTFLIQKLIGQRWKKASLKQSKFSSDIYATYTLSHGGPSYIWWALHISVCVLTILRLLVISLQHI